MTTDKNPVSKTFSRRIVLVIALAAAAAFLLVIAAVISSNSAVDSAPVDANAYAAEVKAALEGADAAIGEAMVTSTDCAACHLEGDGRVSPLFSNIADVAATRRPPLSAEQYLYEAILFPGVHLVDGYTNAMPNNYGERLSQQDVGHMIAYLLTLSGES